MTQKGEVFSITMKIEESDHANNCVVDVIRYDNDAVCIYDSVSNNNYHLSFWIFLDLQRQKTTRNTLL